jgi:hypothetical protein
MPIILAEAKADAAKSGVGMQIRSSNMSYCDFLAEYNNPA